MNTPPHRFFLSALAWVLAPVAASLAGLGEGITTGRLTLRPYVDASVVYDSNAQRVTDSNSDTDTAESEDPSPPPADGEEPAEAQPLESISDTYYELRGGTSFLWYGEQTVLSGSVWAFMRRYSDQDIQDEEGFGERLALIGGDREKLSWSLFHSFERRSDFTLRSPEPINTEPIIDLTPPLTAPGESTELQEELLRTRSERDIQTVGIDFGRDMTDKLELDAGYSYYDTEYLDPSLFDSDRQTATASLGHKFTHKTTSFVSGSYGLDDNEGYVDAISFYQLLFGLRSSTSPKVSYNIGIGYNSYETADYAPRELDDGTIVNSDGSRILPDGTVVPPQPIIDPDTGETIVAVERDDDLSGLAYDASITWRPTNKLSFGLNGRNGYDSTSNGRQRKVNLIGLSAAHRTTDAISLSARISYRDEESPDEVVVVDSSGGVRRLQENREYVTAGARIGYRPPRQWYEFYADASWEDIDSNVENQAYDRYRFGAGVKATY